MKRLLSRLTLPVAAWDREADSHPHDKTLFTPIATSTALPSEREPGLSPASQDNIEMFSKPRAPTSAAALLVQKGRRDRKVRRKYPEKERNTMRDSEMYTEWKINSKTTARPGRESGGGKNKKPSHRATKTASYTARLHPGTSQGVWRQILGLPSSRNPKAPIPRATEFSTTQTNLRK